MSVARIIPALNRADPKRAVDGSKALNPKLESIARMVANGDLSNTAIAARARVSLSTVKRVRVHPVAVARIAFLRERITESAYALEPLVDKRSRVLAAAKLARVLHETLEANDYQDTIAVTKQGVPIKAHDRWRVQHYLDALAAVHRMVEGPSTTSTTSTTVNVGISMEDAAVRVQALLSRLPDAIDAESQLVEGVSPSEGGGMGSSPA